MLHLVCLLHHLGSQDFQLHHPELLFPLPIMVCATSVVNQGTVLGNATTIRKRASWLCLQLVVTISPATTMLSLMVVLMPTTLISTKLKTSLLL